MQAALFRGGRRLDPNGGIEIELIPTRAQHFATPRAGEQDQPHRIGGALASRAAHSRPISSVER
ncbi:hypothetical protein [Rhizobium mongolense]|uniref:Uncharacterized protein n=1 Tax=Rhizobium mongolense TaxID=57676 RepID=A0ABR6IXB1_9HYPH|nr:hypothetical protein [Rhizobium mongolense]MBB4232420.1 hypothetical protein [Rhizobium mongolense]